MKDFTILYDYCLDKFILEPLDEDQVAEKYRGQLKPSQLEICDSFVTDSNDYAKAYYDGYWAAMRKGD